MPDQPTDAIYDALDCFIDRECEEYLTARDHAVNRITDEDELEDEVCYLYDATAHALVDLVKEYL